MRLSGRFRLSFSLLNVVLSFAVLAALWASIRALSVPAYEDVSFLSLNLVPVVGRSAARGSISLDERLASHRARLRSPAFLRRALDDPKLSRLPRLRASADAVAELRRSLDVSSPPRSNLILLVARGNSIRETYEILGAVQDAYLRETQPRDERVSLTEINRRSRESAPLLDEAWKIFAAALGAVVVAAVVLFVPLRRSGITPFEAAPRFDRALPR